MRQVTEVGSPTEQAALYTAAESDYDAALDRFLITDPDALMEMMLDLSGYNSSEKAKIERLYKTTKRLYGNRTRDLSDTPSLLHAVRVAFPAPSEGDVPVETTLGRLGHDLTEKPFGINPQDFHEYGAGTVLVVSALGRRFGEEYFLEYSPRIVKTDSDHPELLIVPSKGKDFDDNSSDPFALPVHIARKPNTKDEMDAHLLKMSAAIPIVFPMGQTSQRPELAIAKTRAQISVSRGIVANASPDLVITRKKG